MLLNFEDDHNIEKRLVIFEKAFYLISYFEYISANIYQNS